MTETKGNAITVDSVPEGVDQFIAAVPWDDHRVVLVHRREYRGRRYVRLRTWNRHRDKSWWYPTERYFVILLDKADAIADAIRAAARGEPLDEKPAWLEAFEQRKKSEHKRGSIRWRRMDAIIADRRKQTAGLVAKLERFVDELSSGE